MEGTNTQLVTEQQPKIALNYIKSQKLITLNKIIRVGKIMITLSLCRLSLHNKM